MPSIEKDTAASHLHTGSEYNEFMGKKVENRIVTIRGGAWKKCI